MYESQTRAIKFVTVMVTKDSAIEFQHIKPFFTALGNKIRFQIIQLIIKKPRTVTEICEALGCKQTRISNHLKCLRDCGYVSVEKRGNERVYSVSQDVLLIFSSITKQLQKAPRICKGCQVCRE